MTDIKYRFKNGKQLGRSPTERSEEIMNTPIKSRLRKRNETSENSEHKEKRLSTHQRDEIRRVAIENERLIQNILNTKSKLNKSQIEHEWWNKVQGYSNQLKKNHFQIKYQPNLNRTLNDFENTANHNSTTTKSSGSYKYQIPLQTVIEQAPKSNKGNMPKFNKFAVYTQKRGSMHSKTVLDHSNILPVLKSNRIADNQQVVHTVN
ncbi:UNKNOWN [Stylonychia lemnae]|uniref:Uncharacterized protein n=1 Tax=Stylonychia lemnae TaxID=5949 RepID=A0A078A6U0_STYLE|nr:UNKNOWN [Stylonychia lemnae]|eukprot:CDW77601.1 UNKNOWN [Stylonychia lemnae]